jgi:predicted CXXCH cytochrome family protein
VDLKQYTMLPLRRLLIAGCVGAMAVAAVLIAQDRTRGPHQSLGACPECHLSGTEVLPEQAPRLIATQEVLCARCHRDALRLSHPTGIVPRRALPADYPLDWKGELTCSSCHDTHGHEPGLLRGAKRARDFCLACHDIAFFTRMKDEGTSIVISGHLDVGHRPAAAAIDGYSLHCLGCHAGGYSAMGGTVTVSRTGVVQHGSGSSPHPIGRSYRDSARKGGFNPEATLAAKKIVLPDGMLSCVSCHEAYKADHGQLLMSNEGSALCLSCHAK